MYLLLLCQALFHTLQGTNASLVMQNKLRIERGFVATETAFGVFEGIRDGTIPYPQDRVSNNLLTIKGDAGGTIDFSNTSDQVQAFRDIIHDEAEGRVSGILRIQDLKQRKYEYAKELVSTAVENSVIEDGGTIHLYLSRPESAALANHTDIYDIFVLQLAGAKEWILCDNQIPRLLDTKLRGKLDKCTTYTPAEMDSLYCERTTLYPGDALYLPKQVVHSARATSAGLSAHLTFGFAKNTCSVNEMSRCVNPGVVDTDQFRRRLCNSEEGGTQCDDSCDHSCFLGASCDSSCESSCNTCPTPNPTRRPTRPPTPPPTTLPSVTPSTSPSDSPSGTPSRTPSAMPTQSPTPKPSPGPSAPPTPPPTREPTSLPTEKPSKLPTVHPSLLPSIQPSKGPTSNPSEVPTRSDSSLPTSAPTPKPSPGPTTPPTLSPTPRNSSSPTQRPSELPTNLSSQSPSYIPTQELSMWPSILPTTIEAMEVIVAVEATEGTVGAASFYGLAGGAAAVILFLLYLLCRKRSNKVEKTSIEVKQRGDGSIKVKKLTKYKGISRPHTETLDFPNEPTANANGYFLNRADKPSQRSDHLMLAPPTSSTSQPTTQLSTQTPTQSPTKSVSEEEIPVAAAILDEGDAGEQTVMASGPALGGAETAAAASSVSQRSVEAVEEKEAARRDNRSTQAPGATGASFSASQRSAEDIKAKEATRQDRAARRADEERNAKDTARGHNRSSKNSKTSRPGAFVSNDGDDSRATRKAGKSASSRSNRGSGSSTTSRSRRSSDEKSEARRHRSSGPSTPGAHRSDSHKSPQSHHKSTGSSSRGASGSGRRSGGRSRRKVLSSGEVQKIAPPDISKVSAKSHD